MKIAAAVNAYRIVEAVVIQARVVRRDEARLAALIRHHVTVSILLPLPSIVAALDHCDPSQRRSRARMEHAVTVNDVKRFNETQQREERAQRSRRQTLERGPGEKSVSEPCIKD